MKHILSIFFLLLLSYNLCAQTFMPSYTPSIGYKKGFVVKQNKDTIHGTFTKIFHTENITSLTVKDENDVKHKLQEQDIYKVYIKFSDLDKFSTAMEGSSSQKEFRQTSFKQIFKADHFIWEHTITPKKGKIKILQLVNPGFDTEIKVYRNPTSGETGGLSLGGVKMTGGIEKSYFLVKKGETIATEIEKGKYKKQFFEVLANDCPKLLEVVGKKKPDWDDLPTHIFAYDQLYSQQ